MRDEGKGKKADGGPDSLTEKESAGKEREEVIA